MKLLARIDKVLSTLTRILRENQGGERVSASESKTRMVKFDVLKLPLGYPRRSWVVPCRRLRVMAMRRRGTAHVAR